MPGDLTLIGLGVDCESVAVSLLSLTVDAEEMLGALPWVSAPPPLPAAALLLPSAAFVAAAAL